MQVIELNCAGCGGAVSTDQKECPRCRRPVVISSFNSAFSMPIPDINKYAKTYREALANNPDSQVLNTALAMCYLKLKLYDKSISAFDKAIEDDFDNSETFFYAAVSLLKGKKAFVASQTEIDRIIENINVAIDIEPRGIYHYFLAYIKYDYFERHYFEISPDWQETLQIAQQNGVSQADIAQLFEVLGVEIPKCLGM
jgi:tetratricopeptide (TPR) repeat protein